MSFTGPVSEALDAAGVRVRPPSLHFMDVLVGHTYIATLTVTNISKIGRWIAVRAPEDPQLSLIVTNPDKPVAPGLQVTATVEYRPKAKEDVEDKMFICVDGESIEIPVMGWTPSCILEMDTEVDFGTVVANSKVISKEIYIINHGSTAGTFKIKCSGSLPISIQPKSGVVEPKAMYLINVDLCTDQPRTVDEIVTVQLQGLDDTELVIRGTVVEQVLELLDMSHDTLHCIDFGCAYFGTSTTQKAILYNNSPELLDWVAVLDDDAPGIELGTDLRKSTDALLQNPELLNQHRNEEAARLIYCIPNQGILLPFQKAIVTLGFSPKRFDDEITLAEMYSHQDYVLFMRFEPVGSKDGVLKAQVNEASDVPKKKRQFVELALKGSGLPVHLTFTPGPVFDFRDCFMGERIDILSSLKNESSSLSVAYSVRKTPHFQIWPAKLKVQPGHSQDVMFSFAPHQVGTFRVKQVLDIIGPVSEDNSQPLKMKAFHQIALSLFGICRAATKKIIMKVNPGLSPLVSNPTGHYVGVMPEETATYTGSAQVAMLNATQTHIHSHLKKNGEDTDALVAFPNDRSGSMRPSDRQKKYRTIFTKVDRYTYVDPDFAYTDEEDAQRQAHKEHYAEYLRSFREDRLKEQKACEFEELNNAVDIGLKPASGLKPPKISFADVQKEHRKPKPPLSLKGRLLTTRELAAEVSKSTASTINSGLHAIPTGTQEKEDCSLTLTPQQLHRIVIGPSTISFGEVCTYSTNSKQMNIINNLTTYIWVQLEIESEELQQTCPLSHVVPPLSQMNIPVMFETNHIGNFKKSITYSINEKHTGHVLVTATAVEVALELSSNELILNPSCYHLVETGFRTTVTLYNRRNHPASFSWKPILTEKGIAFSIRPARGTVDPYRDIECEVVWHPGCFSPEEGEFSLMVHHGNTVKLQCTAKLGPTSVQFTEQRLMFTHASLGLTSTKSAVIQNTGINHAFFQVLDVYPLPGMSVIPTHGVIPVGGFAELQILFTPNSVVKFDTRVEVAIRNAKPLELRIGGSVVPPEVDITVKSFLFSGVYINSMQVIPFVLQNNGTSRVRVDFDMSKYQDFSVIFTDKSGLVHDPENPHMYSVELEEKKCLDCSLSFNPKQVAAYDFNLPMNINLTDSTSSTASPPSSRAPTASSSEKHIVTPRPQAVSVVAPTRRVNATVLQQPVMFSTSSLEFELPSGYLSLGILSEGLATKTLDLSNTSKRRVSWKLDLDNAGKAVEDGHFRFSRRSGYLDPGHTITINVCFCPPGPGKFKAEVPVVLNEDHNNHFRPLHLCGHLKSPKLSFDPPFVVLTPVPLDTETGADVTIFASDYSRDSTLCIEIPELELEDGDRINALSGSFPNQSSIAVTSENTSATLTYHIQFKSAKPVSFVVDLVFIDIENNRFRLQVAGTAENCLLTVYPHLAFHRTDEQIILRSGLNGSNGRVNNVGVALLHPCYVPSTPSISNSSSSVGRVTVSTYEDSISDTDYESGFENEKTSDGIRAEVKDTFALSFLPEEDTDEMVFFQKVITAVQIWFSLFGWAHGNNPISIPNSLRSHRGLCKIQMSKSDDKVTKQINLGKQAKTVYDMLLYLSGQMLPGITASQSLPSDPTERVLQLYWQHSTLLTFLKNQGGSLSHIKPEFLLEPSDYRQWLALQVQLREVQRSTTKNLDTTEGPLLLEMEDNTFDFVSKRVWTDVLLQIYKVLVLSRISVAKVSEQWYVDGLKGMPRINPDPLSSNIYSPQERALLTWLNTHYEKTRRNVWKDCPKGDPPLKRWIVNFERDLLDGLVLAAVLASYCPYLISSYFMKMYPHPCTPEQCLHNGLILVNAFHAISLDFDVQATDVCDPNPVMMIMLCVYLHEKLPLYVPKKTVEFNCDLHATVAKALRLKNPCSKSLVYNATVLGHEAADFSLPGGNTVTIPPKSNMSINLEFTSRFMQSTEATLLLISNPVTGVNGATMAFTLKSQISSIVHRGIVKHEAPCYELREVNVRLQSPFRLDGEFRVILVESDSPIYLPEPLKYFIKTEKAKLFSVSIPETDASKEIIDGSNKEECINEADFLDSYRSTQLREFFCPLKSVYLEAGVYAGLKVQFLPFNMGTRYCNIILMNQQIGDIVYLVEGTGLAPFPSALLPVDSPNVLHISNAVTGHMEAHPITCYKCRQNEVLVEELWIPLVNEAREKALAMAAQRQMTKLEYQHRKITGTLESSSIRAAVAATSLSGLEHRHTAPTFCRKMPSIDYSVEVTMPQYFEVPRQISIPVTASSRFGCQPGTNEEQFARETDHNTEVKLRVHFVPDEPGRYPCQILLRSLQDIRVYLIECVVNASSPAAEIEFITPAYQAVTQDIPIGNMTQQDWELHATLEGNWFYGAPLIYVKAGETAHYSLMFKPIAKSVTKGKLILRNDTDGTEHVFRLKGIGQSPHAMEFITIDCQVKEVIQKILMIPNYTNRELTYKVTSDIPVVVGPESLTVKPGLYAPYEISVSAWKRGNFKGVISFVVEEEEQQHFRRTPSLEGTDGKEALQKASAPEQPPADLEANTGNFPLSHKVWFALNVTCKAAAPENTLNVTCTVLKTVSIEIPITNPTHEDLHLDVLLDGKGLTGIPSFVLRPKETCFYVAMYSPAYTGIAEGSVIFQSEVFGEFWYALALTSEKPEPVILPEVQCDLGKWTRLIIPLTNPTSETLELETASSNPGHFSVEMDPNKPLMMAPHSDLDVPVHFYPSALGRANHEASITFKSQQIDEWKFHLSGIGLIPQPMEPASISTSVGCLTSIIIAFRNPTDENVLIDVMLTDQEKTMHRLSASVLRHSINTESAFCLPLKQTQGIPLAPKEKLDIPVLFIPDTMKLYEALVVVHMVKENGEDWPCDNFEELDSELKSISRTENGEISGIRWIYPVHGIPEAHPATSKPAVVCCQARSRVEERIEVLLTGAVPGQVAMATVRSGAITPQKKLSADSVQNELQVGQGFSTTEEFLYEIQYESEQVKSQLESSLAIGFVRQERDARTGIVTLTFNVIFSPSKPMKNAATLVVQCVTGGIWKFPLTLIATEPNVDDIIIIEATGLNKESVVGFRVTSQTRYPEPFTAHFLSGSDKAFSLSPQSGELLPLGTPGTLITIGFQPSMYSKQHTATLIIQTSGMQWTYVVKGLPPQSIPPRSTSSKIASAGHMRSANVRQRNFVRENMKLVTTAVSSPIKGACLVVKSK